MKCPSCPWCKAVLSHREFRKHLWLWHRAVVRASERLFEPKQLLAYRIDVEADHPEGRFHPKIIELVEVRKAAPQSERLNSLFA